VRAEALFDIASIPARLNNAVGVTVAGSASGVALERIADVPIYATDSLARRATSLQLTADARAPVASLPPALWSHLGLNDGDKVRVSQGAAMVVLGARVDTTLALGTVRVPAGHEQTAMLGAMFGDIRVEKA
jgi:NADH-quinone oxidoreductase subunit G